MRQVILVVLGTILLATNAIHAQPVRSAPYTRTPAGTSSGDVVWTQLDEPTGQAFTDQAFEAAYAAYDSWGGDDFIVPWGGCWREELTSLFTPGSLTGSGSNPFFVNVAFYMDAGGQPGSVICDLPLNTDYIPDGGDLAIDVSGCSVPLGSVWFSQQVRMDFNPFGQHYWATRISANENPAVWKNPGNGFGNDCFDWQPANAQCGMTGEDWLFELSGSIAYGEDPWDCGTIPAIGPFGVVLLIVALGASSAYVLRRRR